MYIIKASLVCTYLSQLQFLWLSSLTVVSSQWTDRCILLLETYAEQETSVRDTFHYHCTLVHPQLYYWYYAQVYCLVPSISRLDGGQTSQCSSECRKTLQT